MRRSNSRKATSALRRAFDVTIAASTLTVLSPVLAAAAIAVRFSNGGPVLFTQERTGRGGRVFTIYKFRSMREAYDAEGTALPDGARLTWLGKLLRDTSVDELPNLINVLRGEMSIIGPRPLVAEYEPLYTAEQFRRHDVRPGLTGWAQVNGRNRLTWEEKFALDVEYVDRRSLRLDVEILLRTAACVIARDGISAPGVATVSRFEGSRPDASGLAARAA